MASDVQPTSHPSSPAELARRRFVGPLPRLPSSRRWLAPGLVCALFAATLAAVILGDPFPTSRAAVDQDVFHLPAVRGFAQEWPTFDLTSYSSATTPGYHIALATAAQVVGTSETVMRLLGAVFAVALVGLTAGYVRRRGCSWLETVLLALPLAVSLYTFSSGAWLLPDDAAWLAVLGILIIALGPTRRAWLFGGVVLLALVLVRQNQIWAIAPLMASAWIGDEVTESRSLRESLLARPWPRIRRSLAVFAAALPAVSALVAFVLLWDGFVPPVGEVNAGGNPAMPVLVLALAGVFGTLFGGYLWWYGAVFRDGRRSGLVGVAATFGVLLSALPETTYDMEAGRWTGLWEVAGRLPTVGDHSLLMVALAGLGAAWISPGRSPSRLATLLCGWSRGSVSPPRAPRPRTHGSATSSRSS